MSAIREYLSPDKTLEKRLQEAFGRCGIACDLQEKVKAFLTVVRMKDESTYGHSVRVGLLTCRIGEYMGLDAKALLYAGLLHDAGKALVRTETLTKTHEWTADDAKEMSSHVTDSFRLLAGVFDFSAEIAVWHHKFQANGYPKKMPQPLHEYSQGTKVQIAFYGRLLAMADVYDAMHRINSRSGDITGEGIKEKMFKFNPDQHVLLNNLYEAGIFTTDLF